MRAKPVIALVVSVFLITVGVDGIASVFSGDPLTRNEVWRAAFRAPFIVAFIAWFYREKWKRLASVVNEQEGRYSEIDPLNSDIDKLTYDGHLGEVPEDERIKERRTD